VVYLSALQRGWVIAYAHLRGGNELGHSWHTSAVKENKLKSIEDLIGCVASLVEKGYTHPSLLCGLGSSAGATVLAAAVNRRPDLWKSVVYSYPFLDVLGNLLDRDLPLTIPDFEEFGNPIDDSNAFNYIKSYSPYLHKLVNYSYDNIQHHSYPAKYIIAGSNDYRAPLLGVMKYSRRFRELSKPSLRTQDVLHKGLVMDVYESGHQGKAGTIAGIEEIAKYMAFFEYMVGEGNREVTRQNITEDIDSGLQL
jgi:oligopeptidase B